LAWWLVLALDVRVDRPARDGHREQGAADARLLVAVTVALSLVGVGLWGTLSGSLLPFLLKRLGFDPAASSAPFVATLVDVTGLVIYFSVALVVLRGMLLQIGGDPAFCMDAFHAPIRRRGSAIASVRLCSVLLFQRSC
jgi:hypothetical protein